MTKEYQLLNRSEIIRMAREAGLLSEKSNIAYQHPMYEFYIERFAALVAAAEREACAKVCEEFGEFRDTSGVYCADAIRARGNDDN